MQSWKSPGPGDSRGSPFERPSEGTPSMSHSSSQSERDRATGRSSQQIRLPINIQQQLYPLQQEHMAPRIEGEPPVVRGGLQSPRVQSRLLGYMSTSAGHGSLPQSYPGDQPILESFSQSYSPPLQPLHPHNEPSQFGNIGQATHTPSIAPHFSAVSQSQVTSSTFQDISPRHVPQGIGRRFSPPPMPYTQQALQATSHPQMPRTQTLLPSIASLGVDTSTQASIARQSGSSPASPILASAQSPISDTGDDLKPLPQNLRGDPFRSAKVKTELCRYFSTPKGCIFGDKCNYAHGEHELKFNKLMDMEAAGLLDVEVFRCHVCPTWVATGAW